jgi:hypothetical protein
MAWFVAGLSHLSNAMKQTGPTKPPQISHALMLFWAVIFYFLCFMERDCIHNGFLCSATRSSNLSGVIQWSDYMI